MALTDNIVVYYKFEESSGTTAVDATGTYNGTASTASVWTIDGKIGRGVDMGSLTDLYYVEYSASARKISTDTGYSVNFWFRKDSDDRMMAFGKQTDVDNFIQFDFRADGEWGATLRSGGTYSVNADTSGQRTSGSNSNDNAWHMATLVWYSTGQSLKLYEDATLLATITGMTSQSFPNTEQRIGTERENASGISWNGNLDEWGVWRRELSSTEITELYNAGAGKQYPFVTAYSMVYALGTYTYTGFDIAFTKALNMIYALGTYTYTGFDILFSLGKGIIFETGSYIYTGFDIGLTKALTMVYALGTYTYTGFDFVLTKGMSIVISTGSYIYTGFNMILRRSGWRNTTKESTTWTDQSKASTNWTNIDKSI